MGGRNKIILQRDNRFSLACYVMICPPPLFKIYCGASVISDAILRVKLEIALLEIKIIYEGPIPRRIFQEKSIIYVYDIGLFKTKIFAYLYRGEH